MLLVLCGLGGSLVIGLVLAARLLDARLWRSQLTAHQLTLPANLPLDAVDRWLGMVAGHTQTSRWSLLPAPPIALEIVSDRRGIRHVLLVPARDQGALLASLRAALPGVRLGELPDYLERRPRCLVAAELTMTSVRRPLQTARAEVTSAGLLAGLQPLAGREVIVVQAIATSVGAVRPIPSANHHRRPDHFRLTDSDLTDGEAIRAARLKQADPLLAVSLRVGVVAPGVPDARRLLHRAHGALRSLNAQGVQVLRRWWLPSSTVSRRLESLRLPVSRYPLVLSTPEAAGLFGLITTTPLPGLPLGAARQLPPPVTTSPKAAILADSNYPGTTQPLGLDMADRLQHLHLMGPTGVGKSTLIANLALQDIAAGHGVICLDPKADLCADILARVPPHRAGDVIVLDPSQVQRPLGFNILAAAGDSEQHRELVVDHVVHIWHELYKAFWGPRSEDILRGALLTLINTRAADGSAFTLVEVPELLGNADFRHFVLNQPTVPPSLQSFWAWYQGLKVNERRTVTGPIHNKLRAATLRTPIRLMLGQSRGLDIETVLRERKILLVPLGKGTVGVETASLLGTLLLSTIWHGLLGRSRLPASQRAPVAVFIDEAQDLLRLPVDLADMLAEARSFGGAFTLAHQHLGQITDKQIKAALLGTVRSSVVFQCGPDDATTMAKTFGPHLTADDLRGLAAYEVALRLCHRGQTQAPTTGQTRPLGPVVTDPTALARDSRERYGLERRHVEAALRDRLTVLAAAAHDASGSGRGRTSAEQSGTIGRRPRPRDEEPGGPA